MGAGLSIEAEAHELRTCESFSENERGHMHDAISEAQMSCSMPPDITMPWDMPGLSIVFDGQDRPIVPQVPIPLGYVEPASHDVGHPEPAVILRTKATAFEHAISFESRRTCFLDEGEQMQLLIQKWEAVVSINYGAFDLGVDLLGVSYDDRLQMVRDVLGRKSLATIRQRLAQISKHVKWSVEEAKRPPFPVTAELIKNHVRHLRNESVSYSRYTGFVEVMKFSKHVMGLDCDVDAFDSAWASGILRAAAQDRPLRKQSTVLSVNALQHLESVMEDESCALVDRFAAGVFLFAVYSRARFGDLRKISSVTIDEAGPGDTDHLGYLEMSSASHKMRAMGNRLGSHLPLVAPLKGVGKTSWGKTFIHLSEKVGLSFTSWVPLRPLLPAPNMLGDWTSRPTTSGEIGKWIKQLLLGCDFNTDGFTPHGCKATTLAMLAKYGADSDTRLVLGHHQTHKGCSEVYARDVQSAPLRVLESMFRDIRRGHFRPDETRSGMLRTCEANDIHATDQPLPVASEDPLLDDLEHVPTLEGSERAEDPASTEKAATETLEDDESDASSTSSDDSCIDEVIEEHANPSDEPRHEPSGQNEAPGHSQVLQYYQHRNSKVVHILSFGGTSFLCGRQLTPDYRSCTLLLVVDSMKCQQCRKRHHRTDRSGDDDVAVRLGAAVKRTRRADV